MTGYTSGSKTFMRRMGLQGLMEDVQGIVSGRGLLDSQLICSSLYNPVVGQDGKTYSNQCVMEQAIGKGPLLSKESYNQCRAAIDPNISYFMDPCALLNPVPPDCSDPCSSPPRYDFERCPPLSMSACRGVTWDITPGFKPVGIPVHSEYAQKSNTGIFVGLACLAGVGIYFAMRKK